MTATNPTSTLSEDVETGLPTADRGVAGGKSVNIASSGPLGIGHNRNIAAAATTHPGDDTNNVCTWTAGENITELVITILPTTGTALQNDDICLGVLDATDGAEALSWLGAAGGIATDVQYFVLHPNQPNVITSDSPITRFDCEPLNAIMRVIVEAG